jgi:3'-5' exoribonuclease
MARTRLPLVPLAELTPSQYADFFALLAERTRGSTRDGKPYYNCRLRDRRRTATVMVWGDAPLFEPCEHEWQAGQFVKVRGTYSEHEKYGPQVEVELLRPVNDGDRADGFAPEQLVEHARRDSAAMFAELKDLAGNHIRDEPLRRLVLGLLDAHAEPLRRLPATRDRFHSFAG